MNDEDVMLRSCMNCLHYNPRLDLQNGKEYCDKDCYVVDVMNATNCKLYESALKVLLIKDCDDCPYHNSYQNYVIECTLQMTDELGLSRQLRYKEKGYEAAKAELFSKCPLLNCLGENIINYYKFLDDDL